MDQYKYSSRYENINLESTKREILFILSKWNQLIFENSQNKQNCLFFLGYESIIDWAIWPFVRQYVKADTRLFIDNSNLKHLEEWLNFYLTHPLYKVLMKKIKPWQENDQPIYYP